MEIFKTVGISRPNDCNGGFDIVIGNPPYMNVTPDSIYKSLRIYNEISDGIVNTASLFLYYALIYLTSTYGIVSMIIPKSFYSVQSWKKIRNEILEKRTLIAVNDVGKAFENVGLEQGIVIVSKKYNSNNYVQVLNDFRVVNKVHQKYFKNNEIILTSCNKTIFEILKKIENNNILLGNIAEMPRGISEKSNAYETKKLRTNIHVLGGTNIKQYLVTDGNKRKPNRYINLNNTSINSKKDIFSKKRICYQNLMSSLPKIVATIVDENVPTDDTINNLVLTSNEYNYKILLAILNSNLCTFYLKYRLLNCAILTVHLDKPYVGKLPIPKITNCQEKTIISLVDQILSTKKQNPKADTSSLEHQIDLLVYHLYGLTFEEAQIIDGNLTEEEFGATVL